MEVQARGCMDLISHLTLLSFLLLLNAKQTPPGLSVGDLYPGTLALD